MKNVLTLKIISDILLNVGNENGKVILYKKLLTKIYQIDILEKLSVKRRHVKYQM